MSRLGHTTKKFYKETRGMKVSGGQKVKAGTMLTREGHRWKPGLNVVGLTHLTAVCDGEIYFTRKRGNYRRAVTIINVRSEAAKPVKAPRAAKVSKAKKTVKAKEEK